MKKAMAKQDGLEIHSAARAIFLIITYTYVICPEMQTPFNSVINSTDVLVLFGCGQKI